MALISTCVGPLLQNSRARTGQGEVSYSCAGWDLCLQQGMEDQLHSSRRVSHLGYPIWSSLARSVPNWGAAAQAQNTRRSKTLWFQWTEKGWKKKPRHRKERARDRTHHLTLFSCPPCLCSPPVLPCAVLCFCSPPLTSCKPAWKLLQGAFFYCIYEY